MCIVEKKSIRTDGKRDKEVANLLLFSKKIEEEKSNLSPEELF